MPLDIVVGMQWGDEGKGRIVDLLAAEARIVARYSGGDNAGHTVSAQGRLLRLHLIPSGILHPACTCALGAGMVVNPARLLAEIDELASLGVSVSTERLKLSASAHILTPAHLALDGAEEAGRGASEIGTTRRAIRRPLACWWRSRSAPPAGSSSASTACPHPIHARPTAPMPDTPSAFDLTWPMSEPSSPKCSSAARMSSPRARRAPCSTSTTGPTPSSPLPIRPRPAPCSAWASEHDTWAG